MSAKRPKRRARPLLTQSVTPISVCVCVFACVWVCKPHGFSTATTMGQARRTHKGQHRGQV